MDSRNIKINEWLHDWRGVWVLGGEMGKEGREKETGT